MSQSTPVTVNLTSGRYDIHIDAGLIDQAGALIAPVLRSPKLVVIADSNVATTHLPRLLSALAAAELEAAAITINPGEGSKSLTQYGELVEQILALNIGRDGAVVVLGGGVIGDLAGFAAATVYRGVALVQVPTTLLAQVDSSVGGKTGVNSRYGKNLIGSFHQPKVVIADTEVLHTLPESDRRAGYAEIAKIALLGNADFFAWLECHGTQVVAGEPDVLQTAIRTACAEKARIVAADVAEHDMRALLNLGHTFGHAFEQAEGYSGRLLHGEAVAVGMVLAAEMSLAMGLCDAQVLERTKAHLKQIGLPTHAAQLPGAPFTAEAVLAAMSHDKKFVGGAPVLVLLRRIGEAFVCSSPDQEILTAVVNGACDGAG